jgi:membrane protein DedA with SNARE-associated domain
MGKLIWALGIACAIYVIYEVWVENKRFSDGQKILWTIFAILFNILTAVVYYLLYKRNKN